MPRLSIGTVAAGALALTLGLGACSMSNNTQPGPESAGATTGGVTGRGGIGSTGVDGSVTRGGTGDTSGTGIIGSGNMGSTMGGGGANNGSGVNGAGTSGGL
jgi:hypothetical protein